MLDADIKYVGANSVVGFSMDFLTVGRLEAKSATTMAPIASSGLLVSNHKAIPTRVMMAQTKLNPLNFNDFGCLYIEAPKTSSGLTPRVRVTIATCPTPAESEATKVISGTTPHSSQLTGSGLALFLRTAKK